MEKPSVPLGGRDGRGKRDDYMRSTMLSQ